MGDQHRLVVGEHDRDLLVEHDLHVGVARALRPAGLDDDRVLHRLPHVVGEHAGRSADGVPSTSFSNAHTACSVPVPNCPSTGPGSKPRSCRRCCNTVTSAPVLPRLRSACSDGTDDTVVVAAASVTTLDVSAGPTRCCGSLPRTATPAATPPITATPAAPTATRCRAWRWRARRRTAVSEPARSVTSSARSSSSAVNRSWFIVGPPCR